MKTPQQGTLDPLAKPERVLSFALLGIALIIFFSQLRSLFYFPVYDSYLWWGDESWLMLEFKEQIVHGIFRHPFALGASIHSANGVLLGNMWITALLYGLPQVLKLSLDPVSSGRIVTGFISAGLIASLYYILRKRTTSMMLASFALLLLITSRTFLLTSHSARYDIFTALILLWTVHFASSVRRVDIAEWKLAVIGALYPLTLLTTHHVFLLSVGVFVFVTLKLGVFRNWRSFVLVAIGIALGSLLLIGTYWFFVGGIHVLNANAGEGMRLNLREMPILRPFSRSVQIANLVQRWQTVTFLAPLVLAFVVIVFTTWMTSKLRAGKLSSGVVPKVPTSHSLSSLTIASLLVAMVWLFFESAAPTSYLVHITPIAILASAAALQRLFDRTNAKVGVSAASLLLAFVAGVAIAVMGYRDAAHASSQSLALSSANERVAEEMHTALIADASKNHTLKPRILVFNPAVHLFAQYDDVTLMTTHFIEYPATNDSPDTTLKHLAVQYVLIYRSALKPDYMREVGPIEEIVSRRGAVIASAHGRSTDIGRNYFAEVPSPAEDTLTLYKLN